MATSSPRPAPRRGVVRSLASAVDRPCARPGCPAPARATLTFSYGSREAVLDRLTEHDEPQGYDLCGAHAERTDPPRGWQLTDRRPAEELVPPPVREDRDLGSEETVAVLAAALRAVPDVPAATEGVADEVAAPPAPSAPADQVPTVELDRARLAAALEAAERAREVLDASETSHAEGDAPGPPPPPAEALAPPAPEVRPREVPAARDR